MRRVAVTRTSLPPRRGQQAGRNSSVLGEVLAAGLRAVVAEPRITEDALRQAFENAGRTPMVHRLERYLNALGTIATARRCWACWAPVSA
jgi:biopolymer transport protein ExbB